MSDVNSNETSGFLPGEPKADFNMEYVCSRIDLIIKETAHIHEALEVVKSIPSGNTSSQAYSPEDVAGQAKAEAITSTVQSREITNQQVLRLLEKMYDKLVEIVEQA